MYFFQVGKVYAAVYHAQMELTAAIVIIHVRVLMETVIQSPESVHVTLVTKVVCAEIHVQ